MRIRRNWPIALLAIYVSCYGLTGHGLAAGKPSAEKPRRILVLDLSKQPWWCGEPCAIGAKVAFTDNDTVVVAYAQPELKQYTVNEPRWLEKPGFLHAVFLGADGKLVAKLEWAAQKPGHVRLVPVEGAGFLFLTDENLVRYTAEKVPAASLVLGLPDHRELDVVDLSVAPGGRVAFLRIHSVRPHPRDVSFVDAWVDTRTLGRISPDDVVTIPPDPVLFGATTPLEAYGRPYFPVLSAAEDGLLSMKLTDDSERRVRTWDLKGGDLQSEYWYRAREGNEGWTHFCPNMPAIHQMNEMFLEGGTVLISGVKRRFAVVNKSCQVQFTGPLGWGLNHDVRNQRSLTGNRFTVEETDAFMRNIFVPPNFGKRLTVSVYDVHLRGRVWKKSFGRHDMREVSVALSPDGSRVAVLTESQLQVFELPPP